jgi:hypothetical protein
MHLEVAAMGGTTQAFSSRDLVMYNVEVSARVRCVVNTKFEEYAALRTRRFLR